MSVTNESGAGDTAPFLAEKLILGGTPARDAFQSHYKSYRTFQAKHPHDYHRLKQLAKCVKKVFKGCTIREAAKAAGISEYQLTRNYPELATICRCKTRYTDMSRLASICEHMVSGGDVSLFRLANRIGETHSFVHKAFRAYSGLGEKSIYGLKSKV